MKHLFLSTVLMLFFSTVVANTGLNKFSLEDSFTNITLSKDYIENVNFNMFCTTYRVVHDCDGDGVYDYDYTDCFRSYADAYALAVQFSNSCGEDQSSPD